MVELTQIVEDFGHRDLRLSALESTVVDASGARWIVSNTGPDANPYPVVVERSADVTLIGGAIVGEVPQDIDWVDAYVNSAAIFVRSVEGAVVRDWTISRAWDGIRVRDSAGFVIDGVLMSDIRDDAVENDDGLGGVIRDSLLDGVFVALSTADAKSVDRSGEVVTLDAVLIRMKAFLNEGRITHQSPFKVTAMSPRMRIRDTVIAIEDETHVGRARLALAWDKIIEASGSHFLNLSDRPLPETYPRPPAGFTVLEGREARDFWNAAVADWRARRSATAADQGPAGEAPERP